MKIAELFVMVVLVRLVADTTFTNKHVRLPSIQYPLLLTGRHVFGTGLADR